MDAEKRHVHDFWNEASCGEALFLASEDREGYAREMQTRYGLEPYILDFARFEEAGGGRFSKSASDWEPITNASPRPARTSRAST